MRKQFACLVSTMALMVVLISASKAQSAYRGGSGDGYAMAETKGALVGRQAPEHQSRLTVYPQPLEAGKSLQVRLPETWGGAVRYQLYSVRGQVMQQGRLAAGSGQASIHLPESAKPGIYVFEVVSPDATLTKRLTITTP